VGRVSTQADDRAAAQFHHATREVPHRRLERLHTVGAHQQPEAGGDGPAGGLDGEGLGELEVERTAAELSSAGVRSRSVTADPLVEIRGARSEFADDVRAQRAPGIRVPRGERERS
jgi:hypothetical protein